MVEACDGSSKAIRIYHGTNHSYEVVKQGCWVTLAEEEAINYARTYLVLDVLDGISAKGETQCWLLEMLVTYDQVEWKNEFGDPDYDGQHGILLIDSTVSFKRLVPDFD
jgi:hypothetical protein